MHFETILNALPVKVLVFNRQAKVAYANLSAQTFLERTSATPTLATVILELAREGAFDSGRIKEPRRKLTLKSENNPLELEIQVSIARDVIEPLALMVVETHPAKSSGPLPNFSVAVHASAHPTAPAPARLLVVDDEEMVRMVICAVLKQKGYEVVEAVDGDDALRKCQAGTFDLALVDLFMPRLNGLETLQELRRFQPQLRALLLSGVADVREFKGWDSTLDVTFLQKPFDNRELTRVVEQLLTEVKS